jgi:hypothetical protein
MGRIREETDVELHVTGICNAAVPVAIRIVTAPSPTTPANP